MTWDEFQKELVGYQRAWEAFKKASAGSLRAYLDQSALVVTCGREFEVDDTILAVAEKCPAFFIEAPTSGTDALRVNDAWQVEIRFPHVDIDLIEAVKASPYCDQEKTVMRPSSSTVVLKKEIPHGKKE